MEMFDDVIGYPKFYADGGVEIAKGVFTSLRGLEEFEKAILEEVRKMRNYTTINESSQLIKAGLDPNTADMYIPQDDNTPRIIETSLIQHHAYYPCWSLGALIDLMPLNILDKENVLQPRQIIGNDVYYINICYFNNIYGLLNNVVECICWLLKNGYIEKIGNYIPDGTK